MHDHSEHQSVALKELKELGLFTLFESFWLKGIDICHHKLKQWLFDMKGKTRIAPFPLH